MIIYNNCYIQFYCFHILFIQSYHGKKQNPFYIKVMPAIFQFSKLKQLIFKTALLSYSLQYPRNKLQPYTTVLQSITIFLLQGLKQKKPSEKEGQFLFDHSTTSLYRYYRNNADNYWGDIYVLFFHFFEATNI